MCIRDRPPANRAFDYAEETGRLSDEKGRIGKLTAGLIEDGQTVILDGGSTVAAVARELAAKSLHIVTNSLPIAESLESLRNIELTLTGGYLDPRLRVMLGPFCEQMPVSYTHLPPYASPALKPRSRSSVIRRSRCCV